MPYRVMMFGSVVDKNHAFTYGYTCRHHFLDQMTTDAVNEYPNIWLMTCANSSYGEPQGGKYPDKKDWTSLLNNPFRKYFIGGWKLNRTKKPNEYGGRQNMQWVVVPTKHKGLNAWNSLISRMAVVYKQALEAYESNGYKAESIFDPFYGYEASLDDALIVYPYLKEYHTKCDCKNRGGVIYWYNDNIALLRELTGEKLEAIDISTKGYY